MPRIQKLLAHHGLGSRRQIEKWIAQGRITINGQKACLGDRIQSGKQIFFDHHLIPCQPSLIARLLLYHKPLGEICSRVDAKGRKTVFACLPQITQARWVMVGRLDINTSGLLLFTNYGDLAHALMHPSSHLEREYQVRVETKINNVAVKRLLQGVQLEDGLARFKNIYHISGGKKGHNYRLVLTEGRNRQVRRLLQSQAAVIKSLKRIRFGNIFLPWHLEAGRYLEMHANSVASLQKRLLCNASKK